MTLFTWKTFLRKISKYDKSNIPHPYTDYYCIHVSIKTTGCVSEE